MAIIEALFDANTPITLKNFDANSPAENKKVLGISAIFPSEQARTKTKSKHVPLFVFNALSITFDIDNDKVVKDIPLSYFVGNTTSKTDYYPMEIPDFRGNQVTISYDSTTQYTPTEPMGVQIVVFYQ